MEVSRHSKKRIRRRLGSKNPHKTLGEALLYGTRYQDTRGDLRRYLGKQAFMHSSSCVVYKGMVFWYKGNTLTTVIPLPQKFFKYMKKAPREEP